MVNKKGKSTFVRKSEKNDLKKNNDQERTQHTEYVTPVNFFSIFQYKYLQRRTLNANSSLEGEKNTAVIPNGCYGNIQL